MSGRDGHGHEEGGGQDDQDRALDPVNRPPQRVPAGQPSYQPGQAGPDRS
jgi:hypothetical protein